MIARFKLMMGLVAFLLTVGVAIPWIISNDVLPLSINLLGFFCIAFIWLVILEKPVIRLMKWSSKQFEELNK